MQFAQRLIEGRLVSRYKRFFADVELDTGETVVSHCPNPGKMLGLLGVGTPARLTRIIDPTKKLGWRLEALREGETWVGVNTQWPNRLIPQIIREGQVPELRGYPVMRPEVKYGHNSRIDWLLQDHATLSDAWVEIKNVHYSRVPGLAEFPDCVTERGARHLMELIDRVEAGDRAVVVFCVQRDDVFRFDVARDLDPGFAKAYAAARAAGVEFLAHAFTVSDEGIAHSRALEML
ncbi:DNA/RNA nuclease SfsA [Asticcacaulis sp. AND118]|uniref:DNA/RNA nuclease SfsA n=1 Tax=Asticcacaulis sp. AND118 TaxID=2840468 RepID=UPI001CFFE766|nr:DNA/RNA nuclease SfsA [Asticcacaulis sp. AND118]UDF05151.1 DNA/RNA nuclease SfsA [Asticcacaulis sp. AND118]